MKISLITVCWNSVATIKDAIDSVFAQKGVEVEYIVVDGGSTDGTVGILEEYAEKVKKEGEQTKISFSFVSERDNGMYDAMNKGIKMSTGEVIGLLNADDVLASDDVLAQVATAFSPSGSLDGTYADIRFVKDEHPSLNTHTSKLNTLRNLPSSRYCSGKRFRSWMFRFGVQTAHPSTFFRRECFEKWGYYSLDYGMFGDFELLCRFIWKNKAKMRYLPLCTTVMRAGGASTNGWRTTLKINRTDLRALRANGCISFLPLLYLRYFFKIWGFIFKRS